MAEAESEVSETSPSGSATKRMVGLALIVGGVLCLLTAGTCTVIFAPFVVSSYGLSSGDFVTLIAVVVPAVLFGWGLIAFGRYLRRGVT